MMKKQSNRDPQWPENAWRLHLRFEMPSLESAVVEYAIFCEDPINQFAADRKRAEHVLQEQLEGIESPSGAKPSRGYN